MSSTDKTRSALRASLKAEDASIEKRLPAKPRKPAKSVKPAAPAVVAATKVAGSTAKRSAKAPKVSTVAKVAEPAPVAAETPAPAAPAKAAAGAAGKASARSAKAVKAAAPAKKTAPVKAAAAAKSKTGAKAKSKAAGTLPKAGGDAARPAAVVFASAGKAPKPAKVEKVVRDSFSMPKTEQATLKRLKMDLARAGRICTKSELVRAGIRLLAAKSSAEAVALVEQLPVVPKGKRKK